MSLLSFPTLVEASGVKGKQSMRPSCLLLLRHLQSLAGLQDGSGHQVLGTLPLMAGHQVVCQHEQVAPMGVMGLVVGPSCAMGFLLTLVVEAIPT